MYHQRPVLQRMQMRDESVDTHTLTQRPTTNKHAIGLKAGIIDNEIFSSRQVESSGATHRDNMVQQKGR
jgi:hypothetical protein